MQHITLEVKTTLDVLETDMKQGQLQKDGQENPGDENMFQFRIQWYAELAVNTLRQTIVGNMIAN